MRIRTVGITGLCAGLGVMAASGALASPRLLQDDAGKSYTLVAKYTAGEVAKYKMKMLMNMEMKTADGQSPMPAQEMNMTATSRMKTVKVNPDGSAVLESGTVDGEMSVLGSVQKIPATPAIIMEIDKFGIAKIKNLDKIPGAQAMSQMFNFNNMPTTGAVFPDHPVKVGESWTVESPSPVGTGKLKIESTLLGAEEVDGKPSLKIKQMMTMPMQMAMGSNGQPTKDLSSAIMVMSGDIKSNNILNVDEATGRMMRMVSDVAGTIVMEMKGAAAQQSPFGSKMNMTMGGKTSMTLISVGMASDEPAEAPVVKPAVKKPTAAAAKKPGTSKPAAKHKARTKSKRG